MNNFILNFVSEQIFGICDHSLITATSMSNRSKRIRDENAFTSIQSIRYIERKQKKQSTIDNLTWLKMIYVFLYYCRQWSVILVRDLLKYKIANLSFTTTWNASSICLHDLYCEYKFIHVWSVHLMHISFLASILNFLSNTKVISITTHY